MGIVRKFTATTRWVQNVAAEEAPRPEPESTPPAAPEPPEDDSRGVRLVRGLGQRIGFGGLAAFTVGAALLGSVSACKGSGQPEPRAPYTEDADKPDYTCGYDGNQLCPPSTPPPVRASCDEPASWCNRGDAAEAVQR